MLAARIAGRVLSRTISFGFKGALVMAIAGTFEGFVFGIAHNLVPRPNPDDVSGSQTGAAILMMLGIIVGFLVFAFAGALTSRRDDARELFSKVYKSAVVGSFAGAIVGAVCFASLFAMLVWMTHETFNFVPAPALILALGVVEANALIGYSIGVPLGFFIGTAIGAWRGARKAISSTRT